MKPKSVTCQGWQVSFIWFTEQSSTGIAEKQHSLVANQTSFLTFGFSTKATSTKWKNGGKLIDTGWQKESAKPLSTMYPPTSSTSQNSIASYFYELLLVHKVHCSLNSLIDCTNFDSQKTFSWKKFHRLFKHVIGSFT